MVPEQDGHNLSSSIREGRRVEREHVHHFKVILLLNSITEMRVGWWERDSRSAQLTFESCSTCGCGREVRGLGGALINERQDMVGCNSHDGGWMDGWIEDSIAIVDAYII